MAEENPIDTMRQGFLEKEKEWRERSGLCRECGSILVSDEEKVAKIHDRCNPEKTWIRTFVSPIE